MLTRCVRRAYAVVMTGKTLTIAKACRYLGVSRALFYIMLKDGRFDVPPIPGMHPRRWNIEDLDAWRQVRAGAARDAAE